MNTVIISDGAFAHNLASILEELRSTPTIISDTTKNLAKSCLKLKPKLIIVMSASSNAKAAISELNGSLPLVGIGNGAKAVLEVYGGSAATRLGSTMVTISHDQKTVFSKLPATFNAASYIAKVAHSAPFELEISARSETESIMGLRHKQHPTEALFFNPESIATLPGKKIIQNILKELR